MPKTYQATSLHTLLEVPSLGLAFLEVSQYSKRSSIKGLRVILLDLFSIRSYNTSPFPSYSQHEFYQSKQDIS